MTCAQPIMTYQDKQSFDDTNMLDNIILPNKQ